MCICKLHSNIKSDVNHPIADIWSVMEWFSFIFFIVHKCIEKSKSHISLNLQVILFVIYIFD